MVFDYNVDMTFILMTWDVTVTHTLAASYLSSSAREAGAVAELAANRKSAKYADSISPFSAYRFGDFGFNELLHGLILFRLKSQNHHCLW